MACHRRKFRAVGFLLEVRARDERLREILRILDDRRHREPFASEIRMAVEVLGQPGILTVRNTVLPQVARAQLSGDALHPARRACGERTKAASAAADVRALPGGRGESL